MSRAVVRRPRSNLGLVTTIREAIRICSLPAKATDTVAPGRRCGQPHAEPAAGHLGAILDDWWRPRMVLQTMARGAVDSLLVEASILNGTERSWLPSFAAQRRPTSLTRLSAAAGVGLMLAACSPIAAPTTSVGSSASTIAASSLGVCQALAELPAIPAAKRAFVNVAHAALHQLAAAPRLDRARAARVLETMQAVEADFRQLPGESVLRADLERLRAAADAALEALGLEIPPCAA
jgi:hypothetical protein